MPWRDHDLQRHREKLVPQSCGHLRCKGRVSRCRSPRLKTCPRRVPRSRPMTWGHLETLSVAARCRRRRHRLAQRRFGRFSRSMPNANPRAPAASIRATSPARAGCPNTAMARCARRAGQRLDASAAPQTVNELCRFRRHHLARIEGLPAPAARANTVQPLPRRARSGRIAEMPNNTQGLPTGAAGQSPQLQRTDFAWEFLRRNHRYPQSL